MHDKLLGIIKSLGHKALHFYHTAEDAIHMAAGAAVALGNHELYAHLSGALAGIILLGIVLHALGIIE